VLLSPVRDTFRAVAVTVVPEASSLDEPGWSALDALVFVRVLEHLPRLRWGRPFTALAPEERARFLSSLERAPVLLLRRGFWGLRTLVFLGYYARPEAAAAIGYRADARGWDARRA
jgi:hypothetical protein